MKWVPNILDTFSGNSKPENSRFIIMNEYSKVLRPHPFPLISWHSEIVFKRLSLAISFHDCFLKMHVFLRMTSQN
jgi:hypothetical protein